MKIFLVTLLLFSCNLFDLSDMLFSTLQVHMNLMQTSHEFLMQFFTNLMQIYEPVTEGSYIKMIDMVSDQGGQMQVSALACVTLWSVQMVYKMKSRECYVLSLLHTHFKGPSFPCTSCISTSRKMEGWRMLLSALLFSYCCWPLLPVLNSPAPT